MIEVWNFGESPKCYLCGDLKKPLCDYVQIDRNQIIGILLLFGIFYLWTSLNAPSKEELLEKKRIQDSIALAEKMVKEGVSDTAVTPMPQDSPVRAQTDPVVPDSLHRAANAVKFGAFASAASGQDTTYTLENDLVRITFSSKGGVVTDVLLKQYEKILLDSNKNEYKVPLHLLNDEKNIFEYVLPIAGASNGIVRTSDLYFDAEATGDGITFTARGTDGRVFRQRYSLQPNHYILDYDISIDGAPASETPAIAFRWINYLDKIEKNYQYERYYTTVYYKETTDDVDYCSCRKDDTDELPDQSIKWVSHSNQFFNSTLIADEKFDGGFFATEMLDDEDDDLKILRTELEIPLEGRSSEEFGMTFYIGPNEFDRLYAMGHEIEDIIPYGSSIFGTINRWVIRPLFNVLSSVVAVKGLVILLLTFLVKIVLFPLTYKMLYSQAKMSALKPQLAGLKEKFKDDMQKQQMETMKVYREFGVSPLGGCLPMLAQMPIWFALYRFFPAAIEFRQADFLWASDLSSYDVFVYLPFEIPFYGAHISLFTLLWAGTTLMYTYYNTRHMDMASINPMMKYMQYFMPVMFLFFFNNYASGLTLYLFYSNVINIGLTVGTKSFIFDDDKIRAELEENRKKPKKKRGFQARLEQAMKEQQRIAQERQKTKNKRK